jgi:hypothetical protein
MRAVSTSMKNRRGSINAVPFESSMLYDQSVQRDRQTENSDFDAVAVDTKRGVSKLRRCVPSQLCDNNEMCCDVTDVLLCNGCDFIIHFSS